MNTGREETLRYHQSFYAAHLLYEPGTWLHTPAPYIMQVVDHLPRNQACKVLDIGSGVGRHCIALAQQLPPNSSIVAVDILPLAIEKLMKNARKYGVAKSLTAVVADIEDFPIASNSIDLVISCSALEHVSSKDVLRSRLADLQSGTRDHGIHCFMINTDFREISAAGEELFGTIEFALSLGEASSLIEELYSSWDILDQSTKRWEVSEYRGDDRYNVVSTCLQILARKSEPRSHLSM
ncbi:MAG: class I SAM-dependent methyltransferase [Candidatus Latescibacteria bacterium]|nr:class I SAM-dependent methyltransferase [Candidatus Latescibacterota bacterium]